MIFLKSSLPIPILNLGCSSVSFHLSILQQSSIILWPNASDGPKSLDHSDHPLALNSNLLNAVYFHFNYFQCFPILIVSVKFFQFPQIFLFWCFCESLLRSNNSFEFLILFLFLFPFWRDKICEFTVVSLVLSNHSNRFNNFNHFRGWSRFLIRQFKIWELNSEISRNLQWFHFQKFITIVFDRNQILFLKPLR
jgi:hypothetical protein